MSHDVGLRRRAYIELQPPTAVAVYGYPKRPAAEIAVRAMRAYERRFQRIIACCHGAEDLAIYQSLLA